MKAKRRSAGVEGHYLNWMLAILVIAILLALLVPGVSANWWRSEVTIDNSGGGLLTDYQVLVELTDYTHIDSSGDSIRFTNIANSTKYDYWIESWNDGGTSKIWVEVPSIAAGTSNMYLWSNADGASPESSGAATFEFFDDFGNLGSWETKGASVSEDGILTLDPDGSTAAYAVRTTTTGSNLAIRTRQNWGVDTDWGWKEQGTGWASVGTGSEYGHASGSSYVAANKLWKDGDDYLYTRTVGEDEECRKLVTSLSGSWHILDVRRLSASAELSVDDGDAVTCTEHTPTGEYNQHIWYQKSGAGTLQADWFAIRKYSGSDPETSVGGAEDAGAGQPVPELSTVILFSVGLIVLAGYVSLRRREKKKGK